MYQVYGLCLRSDKSLPLPKIGDRKLALAEIELRSGTKSVFRYASRHVPKQTNVKDWIRHVRLSDGSDYIRWSGLFEFLIFADGLRIACRPLDGASPESFQTYLLGQVLSFALVKRGIEPLHSTAVVINGEAVAFLGNSGYGKSSLGAAFLEAGYRLLTDDLLVLKEQGDRFITYPGPPRIKLFPEIARRLLKDRVDSTPMNNQTPKLVIPLDQNEMALPQSALPLKAIYVLTLPRASSRNPRIISRSLSPQNAFVELIKNTFNALIVVPERLGRQFDLATRLATRVPVKSLSYPRDLARIFDVRQAILQDLER